MNKSILIAALFSFIVGTAQAASAGKEFDITKADTFEQGVTTLEIAKEQLGEPVSVSTDADGTQILWWKYAKVNLFGKDVRKLAVAFDKDGKMLRIAHREVLK
jgi:hypothetical protein